MTIPKPLVWLVGALILAYFIAQDSQYAASVDNLARDAHQAACE